MALIDVGPRADPDCEECAGTGMCHCSCSHCGDDHMFQCDCVSEENGIAKVTHNE